MKKEIRAWLILLAWVLIGTSPVIYTATTQQPAEEVLSEPTEDIIRWKEEITIEPLDIEAVEQPAMESLGLFKLTAYCPCPSCTGDGDGITASGTVATQGRTVAVDPSIIPYGTVLIIDGHEYISEDNGGKWIQGKEIDIFFESHDEAKAFGVQYEEVFIWQQQMKS